MGRHALLPGDFSFVPNPLERDMLTDAYKALGQANLLPLLRKDPGDDSYILSYRAGEELAPAHAHMNIQILNLHTGSTYSRIMREMVIIAHLGWAAYVGIYHIRQSAQ